MRFQPIRVIVADDHPIVRDGLQAILAADPQIQIVGVATNFAEVLDRLEQTTADVLILDLGGMGGATLTLVTRMRRAYPRVAIVVFSSSVDLAPELLQAGVCGYVVKEELSTQLLTAIQAARAGRRFLSSVVDEYIAHTATRRSHHQLARQELNVLKLLAQGLGTNAIAEQLGIDPRSAQNYITNLRRKIGCGERTQLVDWYRRMCDHSVSQSVRLQEDVARQQRLLRQRMQRPATFTPDGSIRAVKVHYLADTCSVLHAEAVRRRHRHLNTIVNIRGTEIALPNAAHMSCTS